MHELYAEGLIDPEIFSQDGSSYSAKAASGRVGRNSGGAGRGNLDGVERIILDDRTRNGYDGQEERFALQE